MFADVNKKENVFIAKFLQLFFHWHSIGAIMFYFWHSIVKIMFFFSIIVFLFILYVYFRDSAYRPYLRMHFSTLKMRA